MLVEIVIITLGIFSLYSFLVRCYYRSRFTGFSAYEIAACYRCFLKICRKLVNFKSDTNTRTYGAVIDDVSDIL